MIFWKTDKRWTSITYHSCIGAITRYEKISSPELAFSKSDLETPTDFADQIDPYMGVSTDFISMLHMAADTVMVDPDSASNLDFMMKNAIKMYLDSYLN